MPRLVLRAISTAPPSATKAFSLGDNKSALRAAWIKYRGPVKPTMKRARQGGIWKRDLTDKEKTLATIGAGAAIGGGTALALKLKAKPKPALPKGFADFKLDTVKLDKVKLDTVKLDKPDLDKPNLDVPFTKAPPGPRVPNPPRSTPEQIDAARAKDNQRAAAQRIARRKKANAAAKVDEEATRSAAVPKAPSDATNPVSATPKVVKKPNGSVAGTASSDIDGVKVVPVEPKTKFKYVPKPLGDQRKKGPNGTLVDTVPWGRSIFGKSFVKVGGKVVTMTPAQMKAKGLRPAKHKKMQGVTAEDQRIARDVSASWQQVKRIADKKLGPYEAITSPMSPPKTRSKAGRRTIKHGDVSLSSPFQNFSATAALPVKNGKQVGSQRQAPGIVAVNRRLKPWQQRDYKKHELQHVSVRKPMSRDVRFQRHPEKLWGDEARADSVMSRKSQKRSLYNISAKLGFIPAPPGAVPARYTEGFKNGGRAKYKDVQAKIRQAHGEQAPGKHTKRNIAIIGTGAGVGAGGATGAYLYNQNRKKNG